MVMMVTVIYWPRVHVIIDVVDGDGCDHGGVLVSSYSAVSQKFVAGVLAT